MNTFRSLGIFRSILAFSIFVLFVGCGGGGGGGGGGSSALSLTLNSPSGNLTINEGGSVTFQVTVSGGTAPYTYEWDFDGGATNSNVEDPGSIIFSDSGSYNVTLTVIDDGGSTKTTSITITVEDNSNPQALSATITSPASNVAISQGGSVDFQATVTGGTSPYTYLWNFSGGATNRTVEDPGSVTFISVGTYNVTLTVTDNNGATNSDSVSVTVNSSGGSGSAIQGVLDTSFDNDGILNTSIFGTANAVAIQDDGKIVVAGSDFTVARFNTNGSLDTTFGGGTGTVSTDIQVNGDYDEVFIQGDGKILAVGRLHSGSDLDLTLVRYNSNGTLDASFGGGDGIVITEVGLLNDDAGEVAAAIQTDGKIVVASATDELGNQENSLLFRYNPDGSIDTTFGGGDGIVTTSVYYVYTVAVQSNGYIIVSGASENSSGDQQIALTRYDSVGALDTSFGVNGMVTTQVGVDDEAFDLNILSSGKILVAGKVDMGLGDIAALIRYNSNGSIDTSFNGDGIVTTDVQTSIYEYLWSVHVLSDGKIIAAGHTETMTPLHQYALLICYDSNGSLDTNFGNNGIVTSEVGTGDCEVNDMEIYNNKIILIGGDNQTWNFILLMYR